MRIFLATLFTVAKRQKQPQYPSTNNRKTKCYADVITEQYTAIKLNEVLTPATTQINLENIMPSKSSQTQKNTYCVIPAILSNQNRNIYKDRRQISDCLELGKKLKYAKFDCSDGCTYL